MTQDMPTVNATVAMMKNSLRPLYNTGEVNYIIRIIFKKLMNYNRTDMIVNGENVMDPLTLDHIKKIISELLTGKPIQYILHEARFYGRNFFVDNSTLIPRPETEGLIDIIDKESKSSDLNVLDIGTGSGCIAITLAQILKFPIVDAIDISENALKVAGENANRFKVHINFIHADILHYHSDKMYNIIVSNPPYICENEKKDMEKNVLDYEPASALFVPNNDPLLFYKAITAFAKTNLCPGGGLFFEINPLFADRIYSMLVNEGFMDVKISEDICYRLRFAEGHKPKPKPLFT